MAMDAATIIGALMGRGLFAHLGIEASFDEDGQPHVGLTVAGHHCGGPRVAHGGVLTSLLDTALGFTALAHAVERGQFTSTVEIKVNFLRPAKLGCRLETRTQIESAGRSLLVVSGSAYDAASGDSIAFAVGTFNLYKSER